MKRIIKTVPFSIPFAKKGSYYRAGNSTGYSTSYVPTIGRMCSQIMCFPEDITIDQLARLCSHTAGVRRADEPRHTYLNNQIKCRH